MSNELIDPFQEIILQHPRAQLRAHVIPLGLNVTRLLFQDPTGGHETVLHDMIVGPESAKDHWQLGRKFLGPIIGRYANRLPTGKHSFDGGKHTIEIAEFSANGVCLHGGPEEDDHSLPQIQKQDSLVPQKGPFDRLVWQTLSSNNSQFFGAESPSTPSGSSAIFGILNKGISNDGKTKGFPGDVRIEVRLAVVPGAYGSTKQVDLPELGQSAGRLRIEYRASLVDKECEATPINITHHWAFNLSASDPIARKKDQNKIDNHSLRLLSYPSEEEPKLYTLGLDERMVPTGSLIECFNTPHDWHQKGANGFGKTIIHDGSLPGYDHFYAWGGPSKGSEIDPQEALTHPRLLLHSPETQLSLSFYTNQSGVQVYTANGQPSAPADAHAAGGEMKRCHAEKGQERLGNAQRSGVALEFGHPHATFMHDSYAKLAGDDTLLRKGGQYRSWLEVELFKRV